jgi:hypothetical protein
MLVSFDTTQVREAASSRLVIVLSAMITQTCESCGREFGCGAQDAACWCSELALGPERLAILQEHFERCLCPDCLAVAAGRAAHRQAHESP